GHGLDLRATYDSQIYKSYYPDVLPDRHIIEVGDAQYPIRDLGLPLIATLPFAAAGRTGVLVLLCFVGAALAAQLYLVCRDVGIGQRAALLALTGAAPFVALVLALSYLDYRMFGVFIPNAGYYLIRDQQQVLAFTPQIGGLGLLFDRVFGLIPRTPLYLLCAIGLVPLLRRGRGAELGALALGWLLYFLYIANIAYWWADGAPPSR